MRRCEWILIAFPINRVVLLVQSSSNPNPPIALGFSELKFPFHHRSTSFPSIGNSLHPARCNVASQFLHSFSSETVFSSVEDSAELNWVPSVSDYQCVKFNRCFSLQKLISVTLSFLLPHSVSAWFFVFSLNNVSVSSSRSSQTDLYSSRCYLRHKFCRAEAPTGSVQIPFPWVGFCRTSWGI